MQPPDWLPDWDGGGIISQYTTPALAEVLKKSGMPTVDLTGMIGDVGLPHIWTNHDAVGEMAVEYLLERGFQRSEHLHVVFKRCLGETPGVRQIQGKDGH